MTGILRTGILSNELELNKGKCMVCLESSRITSNHLEKARRASKSLEEAIFLHCLFFLESSRMSSSSFKRIPVFTIPVLPPLECSNDTGVVKKNMWACPHAH